MSSQKKGGTKNQDPDSFLFGFLFRLKGDKEARGIAAAPVVEMTDAEKKKNKNKKKVASTAVKLEDEMVKEIEFVLAQVSPSSYLLVVQSSTSV